MLSSLTHHTIKNTTARCLRPTLLSRVYRYSSTSITKSLSEEGAPKIFVEPYAQQLVDRWYGSFQRVWNFASEKKDNDDKKRDDEDKPSKKPKPQKKKSDDDDDDGDEDGGDKGDPKWWHDRNNQIAAGIGVFALVALYYYIYGDEKRDIAKETHFQAFKDSLLGKPELLRLDVVNDEFVDVYTRDGLACWFTISSAKQLDDRLLCAYTEKGIPPSHWTNVNYVEKSDPTDLMRAIPTILYIAVIITIFRSVTKTRGMKTPWTMSNMNSVLVEKSKIGFKDIAGMDEPKQELMEFVSFLKHPERYTKLGAKVPNGAILMGPPGTGKTLLAKAVAGESGVPFLSVCGSDFVEMYVGVGPGRIRSLFKQARKHKTAIIYIDEIDAIGRPRGKGVMTGGNDERENTLNALLVEMDGFDKEQGRVIVLASTNVGNDSLDNALLRPGRFDRQIHVTKPELNERVAIFKLHLSKLKLQDRMQMREAMAKRAATVLVDESGPATELDPTDEELKSTLPPGITPTCDLLVLHRFAERMANLTPGFAGADIANICNEGALIAAREKSEFVDLSHLEKAVDRVIGGIERRSRVLSDFEKTVVAHHEAGHAIVGWFLKYCDPVMKISVIPRGVAALGYTQYLPKESKINTMEQLFDHMCVLLGGRVAELVKFGHLSTGASDDLQRVTQIAYSQITQFGMYPGGGHVSFPSPTQNAGMMKPYSNELAQKFDQEVKKLVDSAFERTKKLLEEKTKELNIVAEYLLKHEVITRDDLVRLIGPRPFQNVFDLEDDAEGAHIRPPS